MKYTGILALLIVVCCSCNQPRINREKLKAEIVKAEADFANLCKSKSIAEGFWFFADSSAVIKRGKDSLIYGKQAIRNYYESDSFYRKATVTWAPDFVDVSEDGTMAYTYGKYVWSSVDSTGKTSEYRGTFHTVWRRQANESWRYVWD